MVSRRHILQGGLYVAGALAAGYALEEVALPAGAAPSARPMSNGYRWRAPVIRRGVNSLPFPHLPAGTDTMPEIEHVVVLMMENHSFDDHLGMLGRGDGFTLGAGGLPVNSNPTGADKVQLAFHMPSSCQQNNKPSQEWQASHEQYNGGKNDGFVTSPSGPVAMGYWDRKDLPFYYSLASTFPLADRWFCPVLGQTWPNRRYLIAATSGGMVNDDPSQVRAQPANGTIFDRLEHYGISWRDYHFTDSSATASVWLGDPLATSSNVAPVQSFFTDAASGNLPGFCIVNPDYENNSEEDPQDLALGEAFAGQVINALFQSPAWSKSLLIWTYDEHGGYYDHVSPPPAIAPDDIPPATDDGESHYTGFTRYGFRVPAVVVSPYARRDFVSHAVYDHTSILATVERKWNLPAMTRRDANARDLMDFVDLQQRPTFADPPTLARPASSARACTPGQPGAIPAPHSVVPPHMRHASPAQRAAMGLPARTPAA